MAGISRFIVVSLTVLLLWCSVQGVEIDKDEFEELYNRVQESKQNLEEVARQLEQLVEKTQAIVEEKESSTEEEEGPSCASILSKYPSAVSGPYEVQGPDGERVKLYCNMDKKCCRHGNKGWTRLGYLNMSDTTHSCPDGFKEVAKPVRGCRRAMKKSSCASVTFQNPGELPYTSVCGSFVATQQGSPDALIKKGDKTDWEYDGISVHLDQSGTYLVVLGAPGEKIKKWFTCPCKALDDPEQETLITFGTDLTPSKFCPLSNNRRSCPAKINCCAGEGLPPFCVTLPEPTTDDITVKLCLDDDDNEDITIQEIELLVQ